MSNPTLREVRNNEHHISIRAHLFAAGVLAAIGALMLMTGALMPFAIVTFIVAAVYAVGVIIFAKVQDRLDFGTAPPLPQELDSSADYHKAKNG